MKILVSALLLLLAASPVSAIGPEEVEYKGRTAKGRVIGLQFLSDPATYGSGEKSLANCIAEELRIVCADAKGSPSKIIYEQGVEKSAAGRKAAAFYRQLYPAKKIDEWNDEGVYLGSFFVCKTGCSPEIPEFFITITHGD